MKYSIIIPARNEERLLPACLDSLRRAAGTNYDIEVIVVINRSTDATERLALERGCQIARDDSKNLSKIRNAGARLANGDIIVTVDADSRVSPNMFKNINRVLQNPKVLGGGVMIIPERISLGIALTGLCLVPLILYYGISGGLFFSRKADFEAIGGFNEEMLSLEDIDFAKRLKRHAKKSGRKFHNLFSSYILTSCRKFDQFGDWYFLLNPRLCLSLFTGKNQANADKVWYDFPR